MTERERERGEEREAEGGGEERKEGEGERKKESICTYHVLTYHSAINWCSHDEIDSYPIKNKNID